MGDKLRKPTRSHKLGKQRRDRVGRDRDAWKKKEEKEKK